MASHQRTGATWSNAADPTAEGKSSELLATVHFLFIVQATKFGLPEVVGNSYKTKIKSKEHVQGQ